MHFLSNVGISKRLIGSGRATPLHVLFSSPQAPAQHLNLPAPTEFASKSPFGMLLHFHIVRFTQTKRALQHAATALFLLATNGPAAAQTSPGYPLSQKDASEFSVRFTEDVMHGGPALLSTAAFRYGLVLTDPMDWLPAIVLTQPKVVYGAGVAPFGIKWNVLGKPRLHPYAELALGGVLSTSNIPPGDTLNINFTIHAGGGLTLHTRGNQSLTAGIDFSHLSNGYLGNSNPEYNGVAFVLAYHWMKPR